MENMITMNYSFKLNRSERKSADKWIARYKNRYAKGEIDCDYVYGACEFAKEIVESSIKEKGIEKVGGHFPYTYEAHKELLAWLKEMNYIPAN